MIRSVGASLESLGASLKRGLRRTSSAACKPTCLSLTRQPTMIDVRTAQEAAELLTRLHATRADDDTDALVARLHAVYARFPPTEVSMRHLSMEQQRLEGTGGLLEYAVTTVYFVATLSIADGRGFEKKTWYQPEEEECRSPRGTRRARTPLRPGASSSRGMRSRFDPSTVDT